MSGYTKLFNSILTSTIWSGQDSDTKVVWITMLACADRNGVVDVTLPGLAKLAEVPVDKTKQVLDKLSSPDSVSRTLIDEGRRIKPLDRGWLLTNYKKYRDARGYEARKQYMRKYMREYMQKKRANGKLDVVEPEVKQNLANKHKQIIEYEDKKVHKGGCGGDLNNPVKQVNQPIKSKLCAMPGCGKAVYPNQRFCSETCADYAALLESKLDRRNPA